MLAGTRSVEDLARAAAAAGMPAIALADTDGMYAVVPFARACEEVGIQPVYGVELTGDIGRVTLLARTREGYAELCRLVTRRRLDADFSLAAALDRLTENVYVLADDERALARLRGRPRAFAALPVSAGHDWSERRWRLRSAAARCDLRTVAAGDVFFIEPREHFVHRVLTAIRTRSTVGTLPPGAIAPPEAFFHSPADVARVFRDDRASLDAALEIAEDCRFDLDLHSRKLPRFAPAGGEEPFTALRRLALRGLEKRMEEGGGAASGPALARELAAAEATIDRELAVIAAKGLADYFLICWDIVRFARSRGMKSVGRGSAGNSLVSYALNITHVNPLRHNLFFERFLNPEREHLPDFDIDFGTDDREEVLRYIFRRYGAERVAMIGTYSTLKARAAIREVTKALGIPEGEVEPFVKRLPYFAAIDQIEEECAISPRSADIPFDKEPLRTILALARRIGEFPRHMATHPCGLVICPDVDHRFRAAPARRQGLRDHAVVDARGRGGGAPQDRRHWAEGARRHSGGVRDGRGERGACAPSRADRLPR